MIMDALSVVDWKSIFVPSLSLAEVVLRGSFVYLFLFIILRLMRREAGALGTSDLLVVVLIADAAQNAMANNYSSITEGAVLVGTIAAWDYFLDWIAFRSPSLRRLLRPAPLPLIKNGRMLRRNMRQEMISEEELMAQLREQGVDDIKDVKKCCLEGDGTVSVIKNDSEGRTGEKGKKRPI